MILAVCDPRQGVDELHGAMEIFELVNAVNFPCRRVDGPTVQALQKLRRACGCERFHAPLARDAMPCRQIIHAYAPDRVSTSLSRAPKALTSALTRAQGHEPHAWLRPL